MRRLLLPLLLATGMASASPPTQAAVLVHAAGSLREAFTGIAQRWEQQGGEPVILSFGASGLLRERLQKGEPAMVFASADTEHPARLAATGAWTTPQVFARNALCALAAPGLALDPDTLLAAMLRPGLRLGTSTPLADPSGDYAWEVFRKAERLQPGAYAVLEGKALKLTGAADSPRPPAGRTAYTWLMETRQADLFLTYCTNAAASQRELPVLGVVQLPAGLQVGAAYALTVRADAPEAARAFAAFVLGPQGQDVLRSAGFKAPGP
nr:MULTISPECIES: molybdate ABC transporter substrate-binding protein [Ramlibacter]